MDYTLTTAPEEDAALAHVTAKANAEQIRANLPTFTVQEYLTNVVMHGCFQSYIQQRYQDDMALLAERYRAADAAKQADVKKVLGL